MSIQLIIHAQSVKIGYKCILPVPVEFVSENLTVLSALRPRTFIVNRIGDKLGEKLPPQNYFVLACLTAGFPLCASISSRTCSQLCIMYVASDRRNKSKQRLLH